MVNLKISNKIKKNYDNCCDGKSEWRWLGAIDKTKNIINLCNKYPHKKILEIGSGEGSVLQRLSDLKFCDSLYSIEISTTAVKSILKRNI